MTTNLAVLWDQAFFAVERDAPAITPTVTELAPLFADLYYRGLSDIESLDGKLPDVFLYNKLTPVPPFEGALSPDGRRVLVTNQLSYPKTRPDPSARHRPGLCGVQPGTAKALPARGHHRASHQYRHWGRAVSGAPQHLDDLPNALVKAAVCRPDLVSFLVGQVDIEINHRHWSLLFQLAYSVQPDRHHLRMTAAATMELIIRRDDFDEPPPTC